MADGSITCAMPLLARVSALLQIASASTIKCQNEKVCSRYRVAAMRA